ncbi:hypothetical protein HBH98_172470 [Parastagonospora nodorum]|nr:hypothetical protein HBH53_245170 [Parastagonospora nodorum]KAH3961663.1 hypothetical protein HBH51_180270 [Parastagonospora nodorum]KAH3968390.1 hypothetical protein HBH52_180690 [Parastagonospora nodorum]KAH3991327.1 hypothetical protein HBI10_235460 [Parastagonospora nodorum]KAH4008864.1 hypothetical protein HBI13_227390 [Parastagonospora nodorum]
MDIQSQPEGKVNNRNVPRVKVLPKLREIPASQRQFWKEELSDHVAQQVRDKTHDGSNDRSLLPNEIDALALNEIAVLRGAGFFMFLPNRHSWSKQTYDPKSRGPGPDSLRASIPSLIYMRYTWSNVARATYFATSHRSRYTACDFLLNPPPKSTPLYCFQLASDSRYPLFTTEHASFIILRADPLYLGRTADIGAIIGPPARRRKGADSGQRLGQPAGIWDSKPLAMRMEQFKHLTLESLYNAVVGACHPTTTPSSMTSRQLHQLLPRPTQPELGVDLGFDLFQPRSRRDGHLARATTDRSEPSTTLYE